VFHYLQHGVIKLSLKTVSAGPVVAVGRTCNCAGNNSRHSCWHIAHNREVSSTEERKRLNFFTSCSGRLKMVWSGPGFWCTSVPTGFDWSCDSLLRATTPRYPFKLLNFTRSCSDENLVFNKTSTLNTTYNESTNMLGTLIKCTL
jgi:hypothetical protein